MANRVTTGKRFQKAVDIFDSIARPYAIINLILGIGLAVGLIVIIRSPVLVGSLPFAVRILLYLLAAYLIILVVFQFLGISRFIASKQTIDKSQERYRLIFECSNDAIFIVDLNTGAYLDANAAAERLTGRTLAELQQLTTHELTPDNSKIRLQKAQDTQNIPHFEEVVYHRPDGTKRTALLSVVRLQEMTALGIAHDITELKKSQEMMIQTEKMMSIGSLAAGMAHEINNPLGVILQGMQNIERRISPEFSKNLPFAEKYAIDLTNLQGYLKERNVISYLEGIKESAQRAATIVRDMLHFSRKSDFRFTAVKLTTVIEHAIEMAGKDFNLQKNFDFKKIRIVRSIAADIPPIPCVKTEIEQVILNLLLNAAWAISQKGGEFEPQIVLRAARVGNQVRIEIEDNGPGLEQKIGKRVFEPFFTTRAVGEGTGLGLFVSYTIITNNHKGTMELESNSGEGTTIIFTLPLDTELTD